MTKNGPIIVIEDDPDDKDLISEVFARLNYENEIFYFIDGNEALEYLNHHPAVRPFLILSDINMPKLDGFALRDMVQNNEDLRLRCIPYLFFTTSQAQGDVINAYSKSVQGFFIKPSSMSEMETMFKNIISYWKQCTSPNYLK